MTRGLASLVAAALAAVAAVGCSTTEYERRAYTTVENDGRFELRDYPPAVVAETVVDGDFVESGNDAFRILFKYITGKNEGEQEIAMTSPVNQERVGDGQRFSFMMPSQWSLDDLPAPEDPRVQLREEPGGRFASVRYTGFWNLENYEEALGDLRAWMEARGLKGAGDPVWARYDPPFMPWFMRTNEVLIPVDR